MPALSERSKTRLALGHPQLQRLFTAVAAKSPVIILDAQRGREAQEKAFNEGHSRAHFGQSAHNYAPAVAFDVVPDPLDWNDFKRFVALSKIVKATAAELKIPIQWGGDWQKLKDMPHWELNPWREWAKQSKLIAG